MSVIQLVINGSIQAWINSSNLDLEKAKVEAKPQNLYIFSSKDIYYRWKQDKTGGIIELVEDKNMANFDYNNGLRSITGKGPLYQGKDKPLKVINYD